MEPTIQCTDKLTVETADIKNLELGEVYCFYPDYRNYRIPAYWMICHRLYSVEGNRAYFRADNPSYDPDPAINIKQIHLKVVSIE